MAIPLDPLLVGAPRTKRMVPMLKCSSLSPRLPGATLHSWRTVLPPRDKSCTTCNGSALAAFHKEPPRRVTCPKLLTPDLPLTSCGLGWMSARLHGMRAHGLAVTLSSRRNSPRRIECASSAVEFVTVCMIWPLASVARAWPAWRPLRGWIRTATYSAESLRGRVPAVTASDCSASGCATTDPAARGR